MFLKQIFSKESVILWVIFSIVFLVHFKSSVITSGDSELTIPTAISIVKQGDTDLIEFVKDNKINMRYTGQWVGSHYYNRYPLGPSIVAIPFVYVLSKILNNDVVLFCYPNVELLIASFIVALCSLFIYLLSRQYLNKIQSLLLTFIFAFCTSAWSTASRALWQHGPSMLMLTITLYLFGLAKKKPYLVQFTGLTLLLSFLMRPLNAISTAIFTVFILVYHRKYFLKYVLWVVIFLILYFIYNLSKSGAILPLYYLAHYPLVKETFFEAFIGNAISPSRGLFIFSPIFLFSGYGVYLKIKNKTFEGLDFFILAIIFIHWVRISLMRQWWFGYSIGPRGLSDMIPYFIYFLIPVFSQLFNIKSLKSNLITFIFISLVMLSFFINYRCANDQRINAWNYEPNSIDKHSERVWDWNDIQFLRGMVLR